MTKKEEENKITSNMSKGNKLKLVFVSLIFLACIFSIIINVLLLKYQSQDNYSGLLLCCLAILIGFFAIELTYAIYILQSSKTRSFRAIAKRHLRRTLEIDFPIIVLFSILLSVESMFFAHFVLASAVSGIGSILVFLLLISFLCLQSRDADPFNQVKYYLSLLFAPISEHKQLYYKNNAIARGSDNTQKNPVFYARKIYDIYRECFSLSEYEVCEKILYSFIDASKGKFVCKSKDIIEYEGKEAYDDDLDFLFGSIYSLLVFRFPLSGINPAIRALFSLTELASSCKSCDDSAAETEIEELIKEFFFQQDKDSFAYYLNNLILTLSYSVSEERFSENYYSVLYSISDKAFYVAKIRGFFELRPRFLEACGRVLIEIKSSDLLYKQYLDLFGQIVFWYKSSESTIDSGLELNWYFQETMSESNLTKMRDYSDTILCSKYAAAQVYSDSLLGELFISQIDKCFEKVEHPEQLLKVRYELSKSLLDGNSEINMERITPRFSEVCAFVTSKKSNVVFEETESLIRRSIRNNKVSYIDAVLSSMNKYATENRMTAISYLSDVFSVYSESLKTELVPTDASIYVICYRFGDLIRQLDRSVDSRLTNDVFRDSIDKMLVSAKNEIGKNNFIAKNILVVLSGFVFEDDARNLACLRNEENARCLCRAIFIIGVHALEYNVSEIVKIASNSIGWAIVEFIKEGRENLALQLIKYGVELFNVSAELTCNENTAEFVGTLIVIIGSYLLHDKKLSSNPRYMNKLLSEIKTDGERTEVLSRSFDLRSLSGEDWKNDILGDNPKEAIADFHNYLLTNKK